MLLELHEYHNLLCLITIDLRTILRRNF